MEHPALRTRFTELVGCLVPIQLAGLGGGIGTPELALAVARAGGLGLIGHAYSPQELVAFLDVHQDVSPGEVGVNFLVPFLDPEHVDLLAAHVPVIDFFYGTPDPGIVERAHGGGALASWQVGGADEARAAVDAGCDFLIAQGVEAGGHLRGRCALLPLLDEVLDAVAVPVLAAGGIATGRALAAVLAAGADGARVGTRFVASAESGAHDDYVAALLSADSSATTFTTRFSAEWPDAPHRVLESCVKAAAAADTSTVGNLEGPGGRTAIPRWSSQPPSLAISGEIAAMAMYAGMGVGMVRDASPAGDIVRQLVAEASTSLASGAVTVTSQQ